MASGKAYVIGGGVAGLAAATALAERGISVTLFEAGPQAGGRCRSYFDPAMGAMIDNGNHLVLSGNRAVNTYLARIGAKDALTGPEQAVVDFVDLADDRRWRLQLSEGVFPAWVFSRERRVPDTRPADYAGYAPLLLAGRNATIGETVKDRGALWRRLMQHFLVSALNTEAETASAALAGSVIRQSLARGGHASRPRIAHPTLAAVFVDPALKYLEAKGATVHLGTRLRGFGIAGCHGPGEVLCRAEIRAETCAHQSHYVARDLIRRKARRGGRCHAGGQARAVFGIIIPGAASRFIAFHQQAGFAAHFAIEEFHAVLLAPLGPGAKARQVANEAMIRADLHRQAKGFFPSLHILKHAPFTGIRRDDALWPMPRHRARHFSGKALRIRWIIQADVIHGHTARFQGAGEMAHGG